MFKELDSDEEGQVKKDAEKQTINSLVHPEHKNRHRTGYATGDYTLRKVGTVREFIESKDPVAVLAGSTELVFGAAEEKEKLKAESRAKVEDSKSEYAGSDEEDEEVKMVEKMVSKRKGIPEDVDLAAKIPEDIQALFADLRVLGKAEFRTLLRWRESFRKKNGMEAAKPAAKEAADDDQELDPMDALSAQLAEQQKNTKLERRKRLEKKKKQLMRLNLGMDAHADIADESGDIGFASWEEEVAALKAEKEKEDEKESEGEEEEEEWDEEKEAEGRLRELEEEMDTMWVLFFWHARDIPF